MVNIPLPENVETTRELTESNYWSDLYGAVDVAAQYADYKDHNMPFSALWHHGCFGPWEYQLPGRLTYNHDDYFRDWRIYVARKEEESFLRASGFQAARAIGLPFVYAKTECKSRLSNSLLVIPTHTLAGFEPVDRSKFDLYVEEISSHVQQFEHVAVCIHPSCWGNGFWNDEFSRAGFHIIRGAEIKDRNALIRMKTMFDTFEFVTSNGWGSHIAYALSRGARVSVFGTKPEFTKESRIGNDTTWARDPGALDRLLSDQVVCDRQSFLKEFVRPPPDGVQRIDLGNWLIGADNMLSPWGMKKLLKAAMGDRQREKISEQLRYFCKHYRKLPPKFRRLER